MTSAVSQKGKQMDDLISRQAAIDALKKEQAHYSHEDGVEIFYEYNHAIEALKNLPSAQSEPCEDAVSRLAVRHTLCKAVHKDARICDYVREIDRLPSAQPEREKCEWILVTDHFVCNRCGEWRYHQGQEFCGNCGADMRGK